ncbi:MAG: glycosyltransferase family 8 protein [Alphaproteobacteria bacterium]|nr:glycosyltransferase family 8 protein [Alphaproteobacteria bacterium]
MFKKLKDYGYVLTSPRYMKKYLVRFLGNFIPTKYLRAKFNILCFWPGQISFDHTRLPIMPTKCERIDVALSFNKEYVKFAAVVILSLIESSRGRCDYDIWCIVDSTVDEEDKKLLAGFVDGTDSRIKFILNNDDFAHARSGKWSPVVWWRLQLPVLLPASVKRVVYADCDTVFIGDLAEIARMDFGDNLIAGCRDSIWRKSYFDGKPRGDTYINAGFTAMNLDAIRREKIMDRWIAESKRPHSFNDQDVINYTCAGRVMLLPRRFNTDPNPFMFDPDISEQDRLEMKYNTVMLHLTNVHRPWKRGGRIVSPFEKAWLYWAGKTGLFKFT